MFPGGVREEKLGEIKLGEMQFSGGLAFMHLRVLFRLNVSCALLPMVSSPFASP
jgi:hypothetical protein